MYQDSPYTDLSVLFSPEALVCFVFLQLLHLSYLFEVCKGGHGERCVPSLVARHWPGNFS